MEDVIIALCKAALVNLRRALLLQAPRELSAGPPGAAPGYKAKPFFSFFPFFCFAPALTHPSLRGLSSSRGRARARRGRGCRRGSGWGCAPAARPLRGAARSPGTARTAAAAPPRRRPAARGTSAHGGKSSPGASGRRSIPASDWEGNRCGNIPRRVGTWGPRSWS